MTWSYQDLFLWGSEWSNDRTKQFTKLHNVVGQNKEIPYSLCSHELFIKKTIQLLVFLQMH